MSTITTNAPLLPLVALHPHKVSLLYVIPLVITVLNIGFFHYSAHLAQQQDPCLTPMLLSDPMKSSGRRIHHVIGSSSGMDMGSKQNEEESLSIVPNLTKKRVIFPDVASVLQSSMCSKLQQQQQQVNIDYASFVNKRFQSNLGDNQCSTATPPYTPEEMICAAKCSVEEPELEHSIRKFRVFEHSINELYESCQKKVTPFLIWIDDNGEISYYQCFKDPNYINAPFLDALRLLIFMKCFVQLPRKLLFGFDPQDFATPTHGAAFDTYHYMNPLTGIVRFVGTRAHDGLLFPTSSHVVSTAHCRIRFDDRYWEICSSPSSHNTREWSKRKPSVIWRGIKSGECWNIHCYRQNQRYRLVHDYGGADDLGFDVGFVSDPPRFLPRNLSDWHKKPLISREEHSNYKYLVHVDGNTASWGITHKLYSGSVMLWVESRHDYREHFYTHLRPWVHYVPISVDMSDLNSAREWLLAHDDDAKKIAENSMKLVQTRMRAQDLHCYLLRLLYSIEAAQSLGEKPSRKVMQTLFGENTMKSFVPLSMKSKT